MQETPDCTDVVRERTDIHASGELDRDELFDLLQSERRRRVARHLLEFVGEPVPVDVLASGVARQEHDAPVDGLAPEVRERVAISLDHAHLPRLDAAGVVDYDRERGSVTPTTCLEELAPYLATDAEDEDEEDASDRTAGKLAAAGVAGGGLATLLALRDRSTAGLGLGVLVVLSILWMATRGDPRRRT